MIQRQYQHPQDIKLLQEFNSLAISETDGCGYLQPGDIPHHVFNGNKHFDPSEILTIWEDDSGVVAWVLVGPRMKLFDVQVRPGLRSMDLESTVLTFAYDSLIQQMQYHNIDGDKVFCDSFQCDTIRSTSLLKLGWKLESQGEYVLNYADLVDLVEPELPVGYKIRSSDGVHEAESLAEIHSKSFGTTWTKELYQKVMESPGYSPEREFVVIAPNGAFAAFMVIWYDYKNKSGYFEPVGVHENYRRLGLGRSLILSGLIQMRNIGMSKAIVANFTSNNAASSLYKSCGFNPKYYLDCYSKSI